LGAELKQKKRKKDHPNGESECNVSQQIRATRLLIGNGSKHYPI